MSRLILTQITIKKERSISSTTWYYLLQPSSASAPSSTNYGDPPPVYSDTGYSGWSTIEPNYTAGSTSVLYVMVKTSYSDGTYSYSTPTVSSSYEASKQAYQKALDAESDINGLIDLGLDKGYIWYNSTQKAASGSIPVYPVGSYVAGGLSGTTFNTENSNTYGLNTWVSEGGIKMRYNAINLASLTTSALEFYYPSTSTQGVPAIKLGVSNNETSLTFYGFSTTAYSNESMKLTGSGITLSQGGIQAGTFANQSSSNRFIYLSTKDYGTSITIGNGTKSTWRAIIGTKFGVDNEGNLYASNANITGAIVATSLDLTTNNVKIGSGSINGLASVATSGSYNDLSNKPTIPSLTGYIYEDGTVGSTPADGATGFVVSSAGVLQASNAIVYGSIYASKGYIGGWQIGTDGNKTLHNGNANASPTIGSGTIILSKGLTSSTSVAGSTGEKTWTFVAGTNFGVTTNGVLYAAGGGTLGAFTVDNDYIQSTKDGYNMGIGNTTNWAFWAGWQAGVGAPFQVKQNGELTATSAHITGEITATSGGIGGFAIDSTSIHTSNVAVTSNADNSIALSSTDFTRTINSTSRSGLRFAIGDKFGITGDGVLYTSGANITNINAGNISTGDIAAARIQTNLISAIDAKVSDISALSATLGGFQVDSTAIHTNGVAITSNADNSISLSSVDFTRTINGTSRAGLRFAIGDKFGVTGDGAIYASGADITGTIKATSFEAWKSDTKRAEVTTDGLLLYDETSTLISTFGSETLLGAQSGGILTASGIKLKSSELSFYDLNADEAFFVKDVGDVSLKPDSNLIYQGTTATSSTMNLTVSSSIVSSNAVNVMPIQVKICYTENYRIGGNLKTSRIRYVSAELFVKQVTTQQTYKATVSAKVADTTTNYTITIVGQLNSSTNQLQLTITSTFPSSTSGVSTGYQITNAYFYKVFASPYIEESAPIVGGRTYKSTDKVISLGEVVYAPGIMTGTGGTIAFTIPLNRVFPSNYEFDRLICTLLVRCNENYLVEQQGQAATSASYDSDATFSFQNAADTNRALAVDKRDHAFYPLGGYLTVTMASGTDKYFSGGQGGNNSAIGARIGNAILILKETQPTS